MATPLANYGIDRRGISSVLWARSPAEAVRA